MTMAGPLRRLWWWLVLVTGFVRCFSLSGVLAAATLGRGVPSQVPCQVQLGSHPLSTGITPCSKDVSFVVSSYIREALLAVPCYLKMQTCYSSSSTQIFYSFSLYEGQLLLLTLLKHIISSVAERFGYGRTNLL